MPKQKRCQHKMRKVGLGPTFCPVKLESTTKKYQDVTSLHFIQWKPEKKKACRVRNLSQGGWGWQMSGREPSRKLGTRPGLAAWALRREAARIARQKLLPQAAGGPQPSRAGRPGGSSCGTAQQAGGSGRFLQPACLRTCWITSNHARQREMK